MINYVHNWGQDWSAYFEQQVAVSSCKMVVNTDNDFTINLGGGSLG